MDIWQLLRKEMVLEWRQKYAISGILLYVLSTVFIVYNATPVLAPEVWNAIFWVMILFASVNAVAKSFVQEHSNRELYYYTLVHPLSVWTAKVVYNTLLLTVLSLLTWAAFHFFRESPVLEGWLFAGVLFSGSLALSILFTFIAALTSKARQSATLLAILGFPLLLPVLLTLLQLSAQSMGLLDGANTRQLLMTLLAVDLLLVGASLLLFPQLWRD